MVTVDEEPSVQEALGTYIAPARSRRD